MGRGRGGRDGCLENTTISKFKSLWMLLQIELMGSTALKWAQT